MKTNDETTSLTDHGFGIEINSRIKEEKSQGSEVMFFKMEVKLDQIVKRKDLKYINSSLQVSKKKPTGVYETRENDNIVTIFIATSPNEIRFETIL